MCVCVCVCVILLVFVILLILSWKNLETASSKHLSQMKTALNFMYSTLVGIINCRFLLFILVCTEL